MKPKLPAWGIIVGIGLILFGLLGFFSDVQGIYVDELVDLQESILNPPVQFEEGEDVFVEFDQEWQQMMDSLETKDAQWEELDALQEQLEVEPETLEGDSSLVHSIDSLKAILGGEDGFDEMDRVDLTEFERESLRKVGNMPTIYIAQLWIGKQSAFSVEAELIGDAHDAADTLFSDVLKTIRYTGVKEIDQPAKTVAPQNN